MSTIADVFTRRKAEKKLALMPYLMIGYPQRESTLELAPALESAGADMFELGVPFSDPLADGATIQRASERSLANGVRLPYCLETASTLRQRGLKAPLVMMGYYNPFLQYGVERLCDSAASAGIDGLIIPDLPPEEAAEVGAASRARGLDLICFMAPTTPEERMEQIGKVASGFIYCVALTGVTGARKELWSGLPDFLHRVRQHTDLPLVVGFGISTPEHIQQVSAYADGAIVASALINTLDSLAPEAQVEGAAQFVRTLRS